MAKKEILRFHQPPGQKPHYFKEAVLQPDHTARPLEIDSQLFKLESPVIKNGIAYNSIIEETDEYILLSLSNGDQEKILSHGVSVYLPKEGGEYYAYRIERF
jgi:hypothetical protein